MTVQFKAGLGAVLFASLCFCAPVAAQTPVAPTTDVPVLDDFLGDLDFFSAELSPSGKYVAGIRRADNADFIILIDLDEEASASDPIQVGDLYIKWMDWATDDRLLISVTGYYDYMNGNTLTRADIEKYMTDERMQGRVWPRAYSRLIAFDRKKKTLVNMFSDDKKMSGKTSLGRVTDFLPKDPDHVLMPARLHGDLDLFKVNVTDGSFERIAVGTKSTTQWHTDRDGQPAFRTDRNSRGTHAKIYAREDRENGKIKWRKVKTIRLDGRDDRDSAVEFEVLYPGPSDTTYYVAARPEGENTTGIYLYDFEKDEILEPVRVHETIDIQNAFFNRETRTLQGVFFYDDKLEIELSDPKLQAHLSGLDVYFDNKANVLPVDSSEDGLRWLVMETGPLNHGAYHVYDVDKTSARDLGPLKFSLSKKRLAPMTVIEFEARDGLKIKGYLTRPANSKPGDMPPLVVMPHGGPEIRDAYGYDETAQILAAYGYQVFQPNFRGSSGFGKAFADKGRKQWGKAMQTDVDDAFSHLVSEGLAEADRACIYGYSYGGYVALAAATLTPDLYQCVIAGAAPTDLEKMLKWERKVNRDNKEAYEYWRDHIGDPKADKAELIAVSPARMADRVTRPVLLMHGTDDNVVPFEQAEIFEKAMKKANKPLRFIRFEDGGHGWMAEEDEKRQYLEILGFLKEHLPTE